MRSSIYRCLRRPSVSFQHLQRRHNHQEVVTFDGDGVGPELLQSARRVIDEMNVSIRWHMIDVGLEASTRRDDGAVITEEHLDIFDKYRVLFKGPLTIPPSATNTYVHIRDRQFTSANQVFRKVFDLYANVRPAKLTPGVNVPFKDVDMVVFRENTEDVYTGEERWVDDDTVEAIKRITRSASTRIARRAFEYAKLNDRRRVTAVHKANVCKQSDGLFLECCASVAKDYPTIVFDDQLADSLLTNMVIAPQQYDILLCPNLFGDLVSDLAAGIVGSLGLMPSAQFSDTHALFEPAHGSAPDIAGKDMVNPTSQLRCAILLLEHLNEKIAAQRLERALYATLSDAANHTVDLGGDTGTKQFTDAVIRHL